MTDNRDILLEKLRRLGLQTDEAVVYLELLKGKATHLGLSRSTGITRSKVYRLVGILEKRGLVTHHTDDTGKFIAVTNPENLEIEVSAEETRVKEQRAILNSLVPALTEIQHTGARGFAIRTYEGEDGFRQMLWHELKAKGDILILGAGTIEDLIQKHSWAEKHRRLSVEAGYTTRELVNKEYDRPFTKEEQFIRTLSKRFIPRDVLPLDGHVAIYNDTICMYHWRRQQKIGVEIVNKEHSQLMRNIFEHYWQLGEPA
jgi:DNA-binding MarR family transcriptional regulator